MNETALQHIPESKYCFATDKKEVVIRLRIDKSDTPLKVELVYGGKYDFAKKQKLIEMKRCYEDRLFAWYIIKLKLTDLRLVYVFKITENTKTYYYSEDGLTEYFDFTLNFYNCFQYAYINESDILPCIDWMKTAVFYQIFIDRFSIGNRNKDLSYINMKWGDLPTPKSFAGGDLQGIIDKLDYIKSLGVNAIYLTPVFKSISNHKYDISNYYEIDPQFGDKDTLKKLVSNAHERGIKIVLDAVFNHCSEHLTEFADVLKNGKSSKYYDWFIVTNYCPLKYECFASCKYMPKFNTSNKEVQKYLIDIGTYWIKECDIDGWRLDVSDEVSHDFWRLFRKEIKKVKSDCLILGENWHDANIYLHGDEFDGIMNYAFTKACLDYFAFGTFTAKQFVDKLNELLMRNTDTVNAMMLNLLDSHDTHRFITESGSLDKLKCALALEFFFVGAPCLYYGTEIAMEGNHDPDSRRAFDWEQIENHADLIDLIKRLSHLKSSANLSGTDIDIKVDADIITVKRDKCKLIINGSSDSYHFGTGKIITGNKLVSNVIESGGFAVIKK